MTQKPVISAATGLPCRVAACEAVFRPAGPTYTALFAAVDLRNAHEQTAHAYVHRVLAPYRPAYNQRARRSAPSA